MSFAAVTLPAAAVRWVLTGPDGQHLDTLAAGLIGAGVHVEPIAAGTQYRLNGPADVLDVLAAELRDAGAEGFTLDRETPPADVVSMGSRVAPAHAYRRSVTVHGAATTAASFVMRAIDRHLDVQTVGVSRWSVTGRTADLLSWLSVVYSKPVDEVLALYSITAAEAAAEDTPARVRHQPP